MPRYDASIHTAESLEAQISSIHCANPDALLVGSLGRAILYSKAGYSPVCEFEVRGQNPLHSGKWARDIDLLNPGDITVPQAPFEVDTFAFSNEAVRLRRTAGRWVLTSSEHGFEEEIDTKVMEPVPGRTIYGYSTQTVPMETHLALYHLNGLLRRKDMITLSILKNNAIPRGLPESIFEPFIRLAQLNQAGLLARAQRTYREKVPLYIRASLVPVAKRIKAGIRHL